MSCKEPFDASGVLSSIEVAARLIVRQDAANFFDDFGRLDGAVTAPVLSLRFFVGVLEWNFFVADKKIKGAKKPGLAIQDKNDGMDEVGVARSSADDFWDLAQSIFGDRLIEGICEATFGGEHFSVFVTEKIKLPLTARL